MKEACSKESKGGFRQIDSAPVTVTASNAVVQRSSTKLTGLNGSQDVSEKLPAHRGLC